MVDTRLRTSFVPKKNLVTQQDTGFHASINLFLSIGVIIFFMTVAVSGGVYLYKIYLEQQTVSAGKRLEEAKKAFDPSLIVEVKKLDNRMIVAKSVLDTHTVVTPVFEMLSRATLQSIRFTDFKLQMDKTTGATLSLAGQAMTYASIANQSDSFASEEMVKNPIFSDLNLNEKEGGVQFKFSAEIDPEAVLYKTGFIPVEPVL